MGAAHELSYSSRGDFQVNDGYDFVVDGFGRKGKVKEDVLIAKDMIEVGDKGVIPLWLFGFLY